MASLSVVIITFNEERNIGRCLESVKTVADEVVVLDSFSTDATRAICEMHEVRFVQHTFDGHIQQKNRVMALATHDLVLSLDADEALTPELAQSVFDFKTEPDGKAGEMNRLTNYCGRWVRWSGWYPDKKSRLWNRNDGKWGGVNPHDKVILNDGVTIKHLKGDLLHYSYYSAEDHYKQIEFFSRIAARELFERGKRVSDTVILLKVVAQWCKSFLLKMGFVDGKTGWLIASRSAFATKRKYSLLKKMWDDKRG